MDQIWWNWIELDQIVETRGGGLVPHPYLILLFFIFDYWKTWFKFVMLENLQACSEWIWPYCETLHSDLFRVSSWVFPPGFLGKIRRLMNDRIQSLFSWWQNLKVVEAECFLENIKLFQELRTNANYLWNSKIVKSFIKNQFEQI